MKKGAKIALGVVGVLVVGGVAAAAWQWNNLNALRYGLTMDSGTIEQKLQENEKALQDAMTEYKIPQYTFSQEEIAQLTDGTLSTEEAAKRLLEAQTPLAAAPEGQADAQQAAEPPSEVDQAIQEQIATMYVLRSTYVGKLEAIAQSAIDEYSAGAHTEENRKQVVYDKLDQLGISYIRVEHDHADTMEDCLLIEAQLEARICKNLFLCNRQGTQFYLLMMHGDKPFKTKFLSAQLGCSRLSFADENHMKELLHTIPGSVSALELLFDPENRVQLVIDRDLMADEYISGHPGLSTATVRLTREDMLKYLAAVGHEPVYVDLPNPKLAEE